MQTRLWVTAALALVLPYLVPAKAQSSREQLRQLVTQLRGTPADNSLRERIIKLGTEIRPAPSVPDEAVHYEGRAQFAFKNAQTKDDYVVAAQEYEKAVAAAPWLPGYYSDLCTVYEKAGRYEDAKRNCEYYAMGLGESVELHDVKRRIAGLEFGIERAHPERARETALRLQNERETALLRKVEGARGVLRQTATYQGYVFGQILEIRSGTLRSALKIDSLPKTGMIYGHDKPGEYPLWEAAFTDGAFTRKREDGVVESYTITPDGDALLLTVLAVPVNLVGSWLGPTTIPLTFPKR